MPADSDPPPTSHPHKSDLFHPPKPLGLLGWIAGYKLLKAAMSIIGAIAIARLVGRDLSAVVQKWFLNWGIDPEGKVGARLLVHLGHLDSHRLHWLWKLLVAYAVI